MSNNKQSSIQQFCGQLEEKSWENASMNRIEISISVEEYLALKEQAKAMHKEENLQTWLHCLTENDPITFEDYYNETFNTKEK